MTGFEEQFSGKKLLVKKLIPFGFTKEGPNYVFACDNDSGEEYLLFSVLSVQGALVGRIRKHEIKKLPDKSYTLA